MKYSRNLSSMLLLFIFILSSCGDDDIMVTPDPPVITPETIDDNEYSAGAALIYIYSVDNGITFSPDIPEVEQGELIQVRISDGTEELDLSYFKIDWSSSPSEPRDLVEGTAFFEIGDEDLTLKAKVSDIKSLIMVERYNGQVKYIDTENGTITNLFKFTLNGEDLINIRSLVFHPTERKYYMTSSAEGQGKLYEADPVTNVAKVINDNSDQEWGGIADIIVLPNGELLTTLYHKPGQQHALMNFSTDGTAGSHSYFSETLCCGMGMTVGPEGNLLIGALEYLYESDISGNITKTTRLNSGTLEPSLVRPRNLSYGDDGNLYGLIFYDNSMGNGCNDTFLATINPENASINLLTGLSCKDHGGLAAIPKYLVE